MSVWRSGRWRRRPVGLAAIASSAVVAFAIAIGGGVASGSTHVGHAAKCQYKLGALLPLTGAYASLGQSDSLGERAAAAEINKDGGVRGCRLVLSIEDTQSEPNLTVTDLQSLVSQHVIGILGPQDGTSVSAVAPIIKRGKIPACVFSNTITITQGGNQNIFRCQTDDADNVKAAILFLKTRIKAKKIAVIYSNDGYGTEADASLLRLAKQKASKVTVVANVQIDATGTDFTSAFTRAMASHPNGIILWTGGASISVALKNARQIGVNVPIIGGQGLAPPATTAAGSAANGVYGTNLLDPTKLTSAQTRMMGFIHKHDGAKTQVNLFTMLSWDAVHLFALAIQDNPKNVRLGLQSIKDEPLAAGRYSFSAKDHNGLGVSSIVITKIVNGQPKGVVRGAALLAGS